MKIKSTFALILTAFTLMSCKPAPLNKVIFDRQDNPRLLEVTGKGLYNLTITQKKNLAVFYSIEHCAACNELKEQMAGYAVKQSCNIYYVNMTGIKEEDYNYIVDATKYANSAYEFPPYGSTLTLPFMHIFAYQGVVWTFNDGFIDYLLKYTETSHA